MDRAKLIQKLNQAISLEWGAAIQYNHYAQVLLGEQRRIWEELFKDNSKESYEHAQKFSERVVALGGIPSTEPMPVRQTTDVHEMLQNSLDTERQAVQVYTEALHFCDDDPAYRNLLEDQIYDETKDAEELQMYLNQVPKVASEVTSRRNRRTA